MADACRLVVLTMTLAEWCQQAGIVGLPATPEDTIGDPEGWIDVRCSARHPCYGDLWCLTDYVPRGADASSVLLQPRADCREET